MLNAIQAGILTSSTKERLEQLEETKRELEIRIAEEKLAKPKVTEEFIRFWLLRFRKLDMSLKDQRQALVDTFINAIYLYDDKVLITFNYKEGTQTVTFGEATEVASEGNGSDLDCIPAPENAVKSKDFMAFLFFRQGLHTFAHLLHTLQKSHELFASLAQRVFRCTKKKFLREEHPRQLAAFLCVHLPDGFKDHFTRDFCCHRRFVFRGFLRLCTGHILRVEVGFDLLCQLQPGLVLRVGVGVHQDARGRMACIALHGLDVAAGFNQLVSGTGMAQTVEHDLFKFRVFRTPCAVPFRKGFRCNRQTVRQTEQLAAVAIPAIHGKFVLLEPFQLSQQFLLQGFRQIKGTTGFLGLWLFQNQCRAAALALVREDVIDLSWVGLFQCGLFRALQTPANRDSSTSIRCIEVNISRLQAEDFSDMQRENHAKMDARWSVGSVMVCNAASIVFSSQMARFSEVALGASLGIGDLSSNPHSTA